MENLNLAKEVVSQLGFKSSIVSRVRVTDDKVVINTTDCNYFIFCNSYLHGWVVTCSGSKPSFVTSNISTILTLMVENEGCVVGNRKAA